MSVFQGGAAVLAAVSFCLIFAYRIQYHFIHRKQSRNLVLKLFIIGLMLPIAAVLIELIVIPLCRLLPSPFIIPATAFLGIAFVEEFVKFGGIALLLKRYRGSISVFDGALFGMAAASGFALVENIIYVIGSESALNAALLRNFTALPLHILTGSFLGIACARERKPPLCNAGEVFFLAAVVTHGAYNWVLKENRLPSILAGAILIVGWAILIVILHQNRNTGSDEKVLT